jgi:signal transduction histidine kinase
MLKGGRLVIQTDSIEADKELMISHAELMPGFYARITVRDTGKGMSESEKGKIFEPFFTTKEVGRGTGLGLAMVYGIITQHKGAIECESRPDEGTIFRIYLPMIEA